MGVRREVVNEAHTDYGFTTLLNQDDVGGLQVRAVSGDWVDVEPVDGALTVNFGTLLERWASGRVRASEHRVLARGEERRSVAFFYSPNLAAEINSLPMAGAAPFQPFRFGAHAWGAQTRLRRLFGNQTGVQQS